MMFQLVFVVCITALSFRGTDCRPKQINENDNFGYNYKVAHSPGVSNVHLNFGGSKRSHQKSYISADESKFDHSPAHSEPNRYHTVGNSNSPGISESVVYDPVTKDGPLATYSSPYDSVNKQNDYGFGNQNHASVPKHYSSHDPSLVNDPNLSHNYQNTAIVQGDPHYLQQSARPSYPITDPSLNEKSYESPVTQQLVDVPVEYSEPSHSLPPPNPSYVPQEEIIVPDRKHGSNYVEQISQPGAISQYNIKIPVQSQNPEYVSQSIPTSQHDVDVSLQSSDPKFSEQASYPLSISQSIPDTIVQSLNPNYEPEPTPLTQHAVDSIVPIENPIVKGYSPDTDDQHLSGQVSTAAVGPKYILVPSGPAYTRDSFSAEIIHGPGESSLKSIPSSPTYDTKLPETDVVAVSPVSHSIPLSLNLETSAPIPDSPNPHSSLLSDNVSPISHSTRLLIPSRAVPSNPVIVETAPVIPAEPISIQEEKVSEIAPLSHSIRLLIPIDNISPKTVSNPLPVVDTGLSAQLPPHSAGFKPIEDFSNHDSSVPQTSPLSHSFRLNVPQIVPGVLPAISDVKSDAEASSSGLDSSSINSGAQISPLSHSFRLNLPSSDSSVSLQSANVNLGETHESDSNSYIADKNPMESPISHSVRLAWPSTAPNDQYLATPEVQYTELNSPSENFKSSDYPLLAVESKRIKG